MHRAQFSQRNNFLGNKLGECFLISIIVIELSGNEERFTIKLYFVFFQDINPTWAELFATRWPDPIEGDSQVKNCKKSTFNLHIFQELPDKAIK